MLNKNHQLNTPSTQQTVRTPQKDNNQIPFQNFVDPYQMHISDSKAIITQTFHPKNNSQGIPNSSQSIVTETNYPLINQNEFKDQLQKISDNLIYVTQQFEQKSQELKVEQQKRTEIENRNIQLELKNKELQKELQVNQKRADVENKYSQLEQKNKGLEEELRKFQQVCQQMENYSKELEKKLQISLIDEENLQRFISQKEDEITELKQLLEEEQQKYSLEKVKLIDEFKIIYEKQKKLNDKLLEDNIQLQKALRSTTNQIDEQKLRKIIEDYYFDNNEECLQQIPGNQQMKAIKILREIFEQQNMKLKNQNQQKKSKEQNKTKNSSNLKELKVKQEQLVPEINNLMSKFNEQKDTKQNDIMNLKNKSDDLKRQLEKKEDSIQEMERNSPKEKSHKKNYVSFENANFE